VTSDSAGPAPARYDEEGARRPGAPCVACRRLVCLETPHDAAAVRAACHPGGRARTHHLRQRRDRLHRRARRDTWGWERPAHRRRLPPGGATRREPAPAGSLEEPPAVRPAIRGARLHHGLAGDHPGHPQVPGLGPHQGHRPPDGRAHRGPVRRGHPARHRGGARAPDRGAGPRSQAHGHDRPGLGGAEGHQGGHAVSPGCGCLDQPGRAHLQDLQRRLDLRRQERAVPSGRRRLGHRLQDGRQDCAIPGHPARQSPAGQGRSPVHPLRGERGRPLLPTGARTDREGNRDPGRRDGTGRELPGGVDARGGRADGDPAGCPWRRARGGAPTGRGR